MNSWNNPFWLVLAFAFLGFISVSTCNFYCNITTCSGNTLCLFSNSSWGSTCKPSSPSTVSPADITTILTVSNSLRQRVATGNETRGNPSGPQPPASNMRQLIWDEELANGAQVHAQQCSFAHDACRDVSRFQVGQNIYIFMSSVPIATPDWNTVINSWYNEVVGVSPNSISSFEASSSPIVIGHYTQLVWATTYTVGCGLASYTDNTFRPSFPFKMLYVCNYGPSGNWLGSPIYKQGPPASACPPDTRSSDGLCVLQKIN